MDKQEQNVDNVDNLENELQMLDEDKIDTDFEQVDNESESDTDNANANKFNNANANKFNDGSVLTSNYEDLPPLESDIETLEADEDTETTQNDDDTTNKEQSIHIKYSFKGEDVVEGLSTMQALLQFKKNMTYTGILMVVFFVYMLDFANFQSVVLGMLCLVVIGIIWIMPKIHIKRFAKAADENDIKFSMDIYSNFIEVSNTSNNQKAVRLAYNKQINKIIETDNLFVICSGKERVFIVPKRCINEELHVFIREVFEIKMCENFYQKNIVI